jgi:ubiquinone/menaquinone biosynthesis C-methylase UbiE
MFFTGVRMSQKEWIHEFFGGERSLYETAYTAVGMFEKRNRDADKEISGVIKMLGMKDGAHVLDWCGGWGRHAIPLRKRGFKVTVLDFSKEYLERGRIDAEGRGLALDWIHADFRETPRQIQADYAVNLFTAGIGYLGEKNDQLALRSLRDALKPGAKILIDTMNLFWIMRNFLPSAWHESEDGTKWYLERRRFDFRTNHVHTTSMYRDRTTGEEMNCEHGLRVYSPAELGRVLEVAGFKVLDIYGDFDSSEFSLTSKRVIMTAQKE